jgi:hypothetical protein
MKKIFFPIFFFFVFIICNNNCIAQVNKHLSNLVAPTAINVNLLPREDKQYDLGSKDKSWKDLYLDGALFLGGKKFLAYKIGTGAGNTAVGINALHSNTFGYENTALGYEALYNNFNGIANTATGYQSLYFNTTGLDNTANGYRSLFSNTTGYENVANGEYALYFNSEGNENTANGTDALFSNATGNFNTALGYLAGANVTTGNNNTFVGYLANCGSKENLNNSTAIGNGAIVNRNNSVRIGNSSIVSIGGYVNWSNISDARVKKNIKHDVPGLTFINKLNPVTYNYDLDAADRIMPKPVMKNKDGKVMQPSREELESKKQKEQIVYTGFVAQDVEKAAKEIGYNFSGVDAPKNENDLYRLRYADFVVPLVKAVQELSNKNDSLQTITNKQQQQIDALQSRLDKLEALISEKESASSQQIMLTSAKLEQNVPNPFNSVTTIGYYLPAYKGNAYINFYTSSGSLVKSVQINQQGKGTISIRTGDMPSGVYQYSLAIDGKVIDTKQMLQQK